MAAIGVLGGLLYKKNKWGYWLTVLEPWSESFREEYANHVSCLDSGLRWEKRRPLFERLGKKGEVCGQLMELGKKQERSRQGPLMGRSKNKGQVQG